MTKKQRIECLVAPLCVFCSAFLIYALLGSAQPLINNSKIQSFFIFGLLGGFGFSGIFHSILFAVKFFSKKNLYSENHCFIAMAYYICLRSLCRLLWMHPLPNL